MGKPKYSTKNNKKQDPKKRREEPLSTSIGELLKAKGMLLPEVEVADTKEDIKETKVDITDELRKEYKATGKIDPKKLSEGFANRSIPLDLSEKTKKDEVISKPEVREGNWKEFEKLFIENNEKPENEEVLKNAEVFHVGKEYITKDGSDTRIRTDEFISKE